MQFFRVFRVVSCTPILTIDGLMASSKYTYDSNGNQHTIEEPNGDITTNTWNGENRLILVEHPDSTETVYRYNGDGLRVFQDHDGTVTLFLYDGNNLLQETDDTGLVEAAFTYIPLPYAEVLSQRRDTESSFYLPDGIRNIRQLTDDTQVVTDEYAFDAFGNLRSATGSTANSQLYKGQLLSYRNDPHAGPDSQSSMHFRNQSATTFRFTSEDPAEDDLNLYRPVGNNPVNGEDPSGLEDHQLGFSTEEKAAKKAAQERRRQLERENEERRQREVSAELDAKFEVRRRTLAARKAKEQDNNNNWRLENPRGAMALHADVSVSEVTDQMHQGVLIQLEPQVFGSADSPRRYGSPGENFGTYLMPGLSAVPFTVQDVKDIRQERLANEAELERSRAILEMGVPGYGTMRNSRTLLDSEATTGQKILAGISVAIDVAPAAGQLVPNLGGSSRALDSTDIFAPVNEIEMLCDASIGSGRLGGAIVSDVTIDRLASRLARNQVVIDRSEAAVARLDSRGSLAAFAVAENGESARLLLRPDATRYEIAHELKHYTEWLSDPAAYVQRGLAYRSVKGGRTFEMFSKAASTLSAERYVFEGLQETHFHRLTPQEIQHAQNYMRDVQQNYDFWRRQAR